MPVQFLIFFLIISILLIVGMASMILFYFKKPPQGKAIVRNGSGGTKIIFDRGVMVIPVLHSFELIDLTVKKLDLEFSETQPFLSKDNKKVKAKISCFIRINKDGESVFKIASTVGCELATDQTNLENLFMPKLQESVLVSGKKLDLTQIINDIESFRNEIIQTIGTDLNGYILDDIGISYIEEVKDNHENFQFEGMTMAVTHMNKMLEFYSQVFKVSFEENLMFDSKLYSGNWGPFKLLFCPAEIAQNTAQQNRHQFDIVVPNLEEIISLAKKHGGATMGEINEEEESKSIGIYDPDKNSITFKELKL